LPEPRPVQGVIVHHTGIVPRDRILEQLWPPKDWLWVFDDVVNIARGLPPSAKTIIDTTFNRTKNPAHFVVDADVKIYQALPSMVRGNQMQAGSGHPLGAAPWLSNSNTIGIEITAGDDGAVSATQVAAAKQLIL
jgi:hypothetical protein